MVKHGGHHGILFLFLIELGPTCNSIAASSCLNICEVHSLLKSYNGGLWKNNYRSGPEKQAVHDLNFSSFRKQELKQNKQKHNNNNIVELRFSVIFDGFRLMGDF